MNQAEFESVLALSEREFEVFQAMGEGQMTSEIASSLAISVKTVDTHICHLRQKTDSPNGAKLRVFAARYLMFASLTGRRRIALPSRSKYQFSEAA